MIFIPHSIESRGHHEKSPAVRNFILTAGFFGLPYYFLGDYTIDYFSTLQPALRSN